MEYTQAEFMRGYNERNREQFNPQLFERDNYEIIDAVSKIIYSCERDKYFTLKVLSIRPIMDYEEIYNTLREHEEKRRKSGDKTDNQFDFINIRDSDIMLLEVKYLIRHNGIEKQKINGEMVDVVNAEQILQVLIALPRFVDKYYFFLNGVYYNTTFQIVDGSTYNNSTASHSKNDSVTQKTMFQPIKIFRMFRKDMVDVKTKRKDNNIVYTSIIFNNHLDCMFYILAAYGLPYTEQFLGIYNVRVSNRPILDDGWNCYQKHNVYVAFPENDPDPMTQSLAVTIYDAIQKDTDVNDLYNQRFWLKTLGAAFKNPKPEKGLFILDSIESIYDQITQQQLRLPDNMKGDVYQLLRWLMREFPALRAKDNVDVRTKKVRMAADYIAQIYATKLSTGIHRVSDLGAKVTLKSVARAIYTNPMYILKALNGMNNLVGYADMVNDNDATTALKFTYKGISGLGENGAVQNVYRYVDPTYIGILDLDVSSTSDPGMSGMICPMAPVYNGFFSDYNEPNNWQEQYGHLQDPCKRDKGREALYFEEGFESYNPMNAREQITEEQLNINKPRCPIYSLTDPSIDYSILGAQFEAEKTEEVKSLFTIRKDDEE